MGKYNDIVNEYSRSITQTWKNLSWNKVEKLFDDLLLAWENRAKVFICGNGGSAANANHLANDLMYGISPDDGKGLNVHALTSNIAVNTCLANDTGYENIFAKQLIALADENDVLIAFSGSGNSPNIVEAIHQARTMKMKTHAVLGFDGGECKKIAGNPIHLAINDMQVSEDFQMMIGHILMKTLKGKNKLWNKE
ncbi:MAG TPA: phosphoheptose isomerase [Opitutae bacterium]|nr:phosphoheptose isomerase [Opitutae bacterium]|tara:strand:- start:126 stop:710 length:585 start_codon:yes stop_codon:yes gene_type:complete